MKKVILINSPLEKMEKDSSIPPLGLGYIAYQLELNSFETQLLDGFNMALSKDEIVKEINKVKPYAITINIFTSNMDVVKYIVENINPKIKIIVGGLVVKDIYKEILQWSTDGEVSIVIGEGEYIVPKLLLNREDVSPIDENHGKRVYKVTFDGIYFPHDINKLKIKRDLFKNEPQKNKYGQMESYIISSRGCPHKCSFCGAANNSYNKNMKIFQIRYVDEDKIVEEIEEIRKLYPNIESIRILDDLFLSKYDKIIEATRIFKRVNLKWRAMVHGTSFSGFKEEEYRELKNSGCQELFIGIESGSNEVLKKIRKYRDNNILLETIENLLKNSIDVKGYFIYGFPEETREDMEKTFEFFNKIKKIEEKHNKGKFTTSVFAYRPYHGTELYNKALEKQKSENKELNLSHSKNENFNLHIKNCSEVSDDELTEFIKKTTKEK